MGYAILRPDELEWVPRGEDDPRTVARLSDSLTQSRANLWRYPPGTRGRRHADNVQEEVFVVLEGTLTVDLGEPPERHEVPRGGIVAVQPGTILQLRNAGDDELVLFIYGARPSRVAPSSTTTCPSRVPARLHDGGAVSERQNRARRSPATTPSPTLPRWPQERTSERLSAPASL